LKVSRWPGWLVSGAVPVAVPGRGPNGRVSRYAALAHTSSRNARRLNAWTSLVDDEGVDLVVQRRERPETIALQVKARFTTAKGIA
jgi:hypothetical protein